MEILLPVVGGKSVYVGSDRVSAFECGNDSAAGFAIPVRVYGSGHFLIVALIVEEV